MADRIPDGITSEHILAAIEDLKNGAHHRFGESTKFDLLYDGSRYPPKAVLGLAAAKAIGREFGPDDFKGGLESKCFAILEKSGFLIVSKVADEAPSKGAEQRISKVRDLSLDLYREYTREEVHDLFDPLLSTAAMTSATGLDIDTFIRFASHSAQDTSLPCCKGA